MVTNEPEVTPADTDAAMTDAGTDAAAIMAALLAELPLPEATADPVVSSYTISGVHTADTMQVPVIINGPHLIALLDMGSTHNFINPCRRTLHAAGHH